jgi:tRNA (guanine10-N2)-dimethyltransferase
VRKYGRIELSEKEIAEYIWRRVKNPRVDLINAGSKYIFYGTKKNIYAGVLLWKNPKDYVRRRAHLRPALHPSSLDPKLAKACVNLLGLDNGTILDPFCGTGGILIEAGLAGFSVKGYDIDEEMIIRSKKNLKYYGINGKIIKKDALSEDRYINVVTDLPYSRNTKKTDIAYLFSGFIRKVENGVIIIPESLQYKNLMKGTKKRIKKEFLYYIHKNLSKKILLV